MKLRYLLPMLLFFPCFFAIAVPPYNEGLRIEAEPLPDPLSGLSIYNLSWIAREDALYTLEASFDLRPPWFAIGHVPDLGEPSLEEDQLVGFGTSSTEDRLFYRVVEDNGIRLSATCEPGQGVRLELDVSRWAEHRQDGYYEEGIVTLERADDPEGPFTVINRSGYFSNHKYIFVDRSNFEASMRYYRVSFEYGDANYVWHTSPMSHVAAAACPPADGPVLGATAHEDRIVLNWMKPYWVNWMNEITILDWTLMRRAVDPDGTYQEIQLPLYPPWKDTGMFVDVDVIPGVDYFYYVYFTYQDGSDGGRNHISSRSEIVDAKTVNPRPIIGPMDVVFIQDNTESDPIENALDKFMEDEVLKAVLDVIEAASGGDYRLALVTTDSNIVNVRLNFSQGDRDRDAFKAALQQTSNYSGMNYEESTDECLNTVVNALLASDRPPGKQVNDFYPPFGLDAEGNPAYGLNENDEPVVPIKVVVVMTDDAPGGFDDQYSSVAAGNALLYAQQARDQGIQINAILMDGAYWWSASSSLMLDYAITTCGWFSFLNSYGDNVQEAILSMFGVPITCSEFIYE